MSIFSISKFSSNIIIEGVCENDIKEVNHALNKISSKPVGNYLLSEIAKKTGEDKNVLIRVDRGAYNSAKHSMSEMQYFKLRKKHDPRVFRKVDVSLFSHPDSNGKKSDGSSAFIKFNPDLSTYVDENGFPYSVKDPDYAYIGLSHELIHAFYMLNGDWRGGERMQDYFQSSSDVRHEEDRAVGLGKFVNEPFTENKIRNEHALELRRSYIPYHLHLKLEEI